MPISSAVHGHVVGTVGMPLSEKGRLRLATPFNIAISALFLMAAITAGLLPAATKFHMYGAPIPIFIGSLAVIGVLFLLVEKRVSARTSRRYPLIVGTAFTLNALILVLVAYSLQAYGYTWDNQQVFDQAVAFATQGNISDSFVQYVVTYPNNIFLLSVLGGVFTLLHRVGIDHFLTAAVCINVLLLFLTQVVTFIVSKMLFGRRIALVALGFCTVFISLSMYAAIMYSDTLTYCFQLPF